MEVDAQAWHNRVDSLIAENAHIITFRGAGTVNGIDAATAETATGMLADYVSKITESGTPVALMFDGDEDNRAKPDIGSVFGGLADALRENPNVTTITAQSKGWYSPKTEGGSLETATGNPYETYVFPDEMPGGHAALTQSEKLVAYPSYEQVFVGPAGPIAFNQLKDLSDKTSGRSSEAGPINVTVIETPNNGALSPVLNEQLVAAPDEQAKAKVAAKIAQRETQPFGAMFSAEGAFVVDQSQYPGLAFNVSSVGPVK